MNEWANRYSHLETKVGGGFYALRQNENKATYTKLVKADRSPVVKLRAFIVPSVVSRSDRPSTRRARRNNAR